MTNKLYYQDAYIKEFDADCESSVECDGGYDTVLDRTAFFPEEGGQSSDGGYINGVKVLYVYEKDMTGHHVTEREVPVGAVRCNVDFSSRFEKMQCHTAEHILCGIIHRLYGFDNVGFHLGDDEVTFDISSPLDRDALDEVERLANEAVFRNLAVTTHFPAPEELPSLEYRSKLDITKTFVLLK